MNHRVSRVRGSLAVALLAAGLPQLVWGAPPQKFVETAAGSVHYKLGGQVLSGTSVFRWENYGRKFRQDVTVTIDMAAAMAASGQAGSPQASGTKPPPPAPMKSWAFLDGKHLYMHAGMMGKQVNRAPVDEKRIKAMLQGVPGVGGGVGEGKVVGQEKVLGKDCQILAMGGIRVSAWKKLPLRVVLGQKGTPTYVTMVATKLNPASGLTAAMLKVPAGFKVVDQAAARPPSASPQPAK